MRRWQKKSAVHFSYRPTPRPRITMRNLDAQNQSTGDACFPGSGNRALWYPEQEDFHPSNVRRLLLSTGTFNDKAIDGYVTFSIMHQGVIVPHAYESWLAKTGDKYILFALEGGGHFQVATTNARVSSSQQDSDASVWQLGLDVMQQVNVVFTKSITKDVPQHTTGKIGSPENAMRVKVIYVIGLKTGTTASVW